MNRFLAVFLVLLSSCLGVRAEDKALIPAMQAAWPGIREDIQVITQPPTVELLVNEMTEALDLSDKVRLRVIDWPTLQQAAIDGINARGVSPGVALSLMERVLRFRDALEAL